MKHVKDWLHKFFFPPENASRWLKLLPYAILGLLTILVLTAGAYAWDYTNSPAFCGTSCHTMPPEYTSYLSSPHARVACVECHIGRGFIATQITRKAGDIRHVVFTLFKKYEFPITADDMRPARETCERCHFPEKFSDDSLRVINHFGNDKQNTPSNTYLTLKTGGGSSRKGLARGIHWHIETPILYYPVDKEEQIIPYVRINNADGSYTEYIDVESGFDPQSINEADLKEMDCITCHNRITHLVNTPEVSVDTALHLGLIDRTIPEIRKKGVEVLRAKYSSDQLALVGIAGLEGYYQTVFPDFYAVNATMIQAAVRTLQEIYSQSVYMVQKSDWDAHPNNIGHLNSPGCFRCHDGKHLDAEEESIRLECNLCHSIPVVAGPYDFVANIEISRGPEPQSHQNSNWISMHREVFNPTCSNCHDTNNPGGTDNSSFCSNSACHGNVWEYAGFNAPALREIIQAQLPPTPTPVPIAVGLLTYRDTIGTLLVARCGACHGENSIQGLNLTTYHTTLTGSINGAVIIPGDAGNSPLVIRQSAIQPHFGQLSPEELQAVVEWIQAGALEQ